ncbi:hypothetical protein NP233_g11690 [Leucocoprinus birnbaumii]|uniref:Integrase core domain-containing protein n=1 Tax=Leucocoprinus birnbaumii TaxID=56174 RepID=A0AAD5VII6_9AGAR|nr:hypothetical protein NP233_g11690 [Leucocoprinus birnbaumii]
MYFPGLPEDRTWSPSIHASFDRLHDIYARATRIASEATVNHPRVLHHQRLIRNDAVELLQALFECDERDDALQTWIDVVAEVLDDIKCLLEQISFMATEDSSIPIHMPNPFTTVHTGRRGHPRVVVNPALLRRALTTRIPITELAEAFRVSRSTLIRQMKFYDIHRRRSRISNAHLDEIVRLFYRVFPDSGQRYAFGHLRKLGLNLSRMQMLQSIKRVNRVGAILRKQRQQKIERQKYEVSRPNALWHLDGHHKLINWGFVIHGVTDGYSRVITGMKAAVDNTPTTVLRMFLKATANYGTPSRDNMFLGRLKHGSYEDGEALPPATIEDVFGLHVRPNGSTPRRIRPNRLDIGAAAEEIDPNIHHKPVKVPRNQSPFTPEEMNLFEDTFMVFQERHTLPQGYSPYPLNRPRLYVPYAELPVRRNRKLRSPSSSKLSKAKTKAKAKSRKQIAKDRTPSPPPCTQPRTWSGIQGGQKIATGVQGRNGSDADSEGDGVSEDEKDEIVEPRRSSSSREKATRRVSNTATQGFITKLSNSAALSRGPAVSVSQARLETNQGLRGKPQTTSSSAHSKKPKATLPAPEEIEQILYEVTSIVIIPNGLILEDPSYQDGLNVYQATLNAPAVARKENDLWVYCAGGLAKVKHEKLPFIHNSNWSYEEMEDFLAEHFERTFTWACENWTSIDQHWCLLYSDYSKLKVFKTNLADFGDNKELVKANYGQLLSKLNFWIHGSTSRSGNKRTTLFIGTVRAIPLGVLKDWYNTDDVRKDPIASILPHPIKPVIYDKVAISSPSSTNSDLETPPWELKGKRRARSPDSDNERPHKIAKVKGEPTTSDVEMEDGEIDEGEDEEGVEDEDEDEGGEGVEEQEDGIEEEVEEGGIADAISISSDTDEELAPLRYSKKATLKKDTSPVVTRPSTPTPNSGTGAQLAATFSDVFNKSLQLEDAPTPRFDFRLKKF